MLVYLLSPFGLAIGRAGWSAAEPVTIIRSQDALGGISCQDESRRSIVPTLPDRHYL